MGSRKTDPDFWRNILLKNCKICNGTGFVSVDSNGGAVKLCRCSRMVRLLVKMNNPVHGLNPKYHKWTLDNVTELSVETKKKIAGYLDNVIGSKNPYRNVAIKGGKNTGKSSVAAIIYKELMNREYEVSIVRFSELVTLSRLFMSNSAAFNEKWELYDMLKDEEFIIIEDVDDRGENIALNPEKLGYSLLDEIFSYRANHPERATIITIDDQLTITPSTLGRVFYSSIYSSDVEDGKILEIELIRNGN